MDVESGVDGNISGPYMIIDPGMEKSVLEISGLAPNEASVADSVHITLVPTERLRIDNIDSANDLKVAFDNTGPERTIEPGGFFEQRGRFTDVYLRGVGGTSVFLIQMVLWDFPD